MKLSLALLGTLLVSSAVNAVAGTYTINTTATVDTSLERKRVELNSDTCASVQLPPTCTQAQARNRDPSLNVYLDVQDLINRFIFRAAAQGIRDEQNRADHSSLCDKWAAASDAQRAAACSNVGSAACPSECPQNSSR